MARVHVNRLRHWDAQHGETQEALAGMFPDSRRALQAITGHRNDAEDKQRRYLLTAENGAQSEFALLPEVLVRAYDEFPGGVYPCEKTLDLLTKENPRRVGTPFSTKSYRGSIPADEVFHYITTGWLSAVFPDPPVIIGYEFKRPKTVHMYRATYSNGDLSERAFKEFEFQGSFCIGGCDRKGDDGWVTLDTVTGHKWDSSPSAWDKWDQFVVPDPKPYKAYRLRITKDNYDRFPEDITAVNVGYLMLMGCSA